MIATAYIVAIIQRGTPSTVIGAGIFGEPHPTMPHITVPLAEFNGTSFDDAQAKAGAHLSLGFDWCGELLHDAIRGAYRDARKAVSP